MRSIEAIGGKLRGEEVSGEAEDVKCDESVTSVTETRARVREG
jgi:hypothetical protein